MELGRPIRGILLCFAWYFSILAGFYVLYCPIIYVIFINHKWYRIISDQLFAFWELYPVALFQWCHKTKLHHYGDYVNPDEGSIIITNHRTRVDWNYVWIALYHATQNNEKTTKMNLNENGQIDAENYKLLTRIKNLFGGKAKIKIVLKDELKNIPGMGWIMQLNYFLYVKRDWREDQRNMTQFLDYYKRLNYNCRIVMFPEGTDLSESNRRRSDRFAVANNLPRYEHVLQPRTTGWAALCSRLRGNGLEAVYDVTIAYDHPSQTEIDLLRGHLPSNVYFHFKRYSASLLPRDEDSLKCWLNDRWADKEISLRTFHEDGTFFDVSAKEVPPMKNPRPLEDAKLSFIFWTFIEVIFIYGIMTSSWFLFWVIYNSLLFAFVTWRFGGFHNIQYALLKCDIQ